MPPLWFLIFDNHLKSEKAQGISHSQPNSEPLIVEPVDVTFVLSTVSNPLSTGRIRVKTSQFSQISDCQHNEISQISTRLSKLTIDIMSDDERLAVAVNVTGM
jgi:hypothetical protein